MFYVGREWMDHIEWVWMTSKLGKCSQLGLGFAAGPVGLGFSWLKTCILLTALYLHVI
jgi:hypothetical protein